MQIIVGLFLHMPSKHIYREVFVSVGGWGGVIKELLSQ